MSPPFLFTSKTMPNDQAPHHQLYYISFGQRRPWFLFEEEEEEKKKLPPLKYRCVQIFHHRIIKKGWPTAAMTYRRKLAPTTHPQPKSPGIFLLGQVWPKSQPTFKMQMIFGPLDGTNSLSIFAHLGLLVVSLGQPCRLKRGYSIFGWPIPWMGGKGLDSNFYAWIYWYDLPKKHILPNRIQAKSSPQTLLEKFTGSLETNKAEDTTLWKRKQHIYSNHQFLRAQCPCSFWEEFMCVCVFNFWACKGKEKHMVP